ncbi:MAG: CPBP family intramembrane glutamic endopeptidase [Betaproteobacteria bacterium]
MSISVYIKRHPLSAYFALTFAISWGGLLLVICGYGGIPATKEQFATQLPVAILAMLGGPSVAGLLLTGLVKGRAGFRELLSRFLRWRVGVHWYAVALLTAPLVLMAILLALSLTSPVFLPGIFASDKKAPLLLSGIVGGVMVGIFEELGWTGFAVPRLRLRYSILTTGLIVGVLWGAWHILSNDVWGGGTYSGALSPVLFLTLNGFGFLVGQLPAFRILTVWVYDRTGSLLVAMLMHASLTASTLILAPLAISGVPLLIYGFVSAAVMWVIVAAVAVANRGQLSRQPLRRQVA